MAEDVSVKWLALTGYYTNQFARFCLVGSVGTAVLTLSTIRSVLTNGEHYTSGLTRHLGILLEYYPHVLRR